MKKDWNARLTEITEMDRGLWAQGIVFAGIDEAGRGPLCGPVAAACVVMPHDPLLLYVDDSKKLTEKRREALYDQIMETAVYAKVALAEPEEIDRINILEATRRAMADAAREAPCGLFLVDAVTRLDVPGEVRGIVHGDALCYSIAAASILAKVTRDRLMAEYDRAYPEYGFAKNKGYGTAQHIEALKKYGPCRIHRKTFIGHFVEPDQV
ncbi:MAG: ribonuclease HII [Clostridia bacterium]|nr:ribonuclease HII [Clostridia bacterium]